jgi:hypothetical protein
MSERVRLQQVPSRRTVARWDSQYGSSTSGTCGPDRGWLWRPLVEPGTAKVEHQGYEGDREASLGKDWAACLG